MDVLDFLRHEVRNSFAWLELNTADVSGANALWRPPGTANSIAASYAHAVIAADVDINVHFYGRHSVLSEAWAARLGLPESFPDDFVGADAVDWDLLRAYGKAVASQLAAVFDALTELDLARTFEMKALVTKDAARGAELVSLGTWKGIDLFTLHSGGHIWMHGGEIACLKGIQGGLGYRKFNGLWN